MSWLSEMGVCGILWYKCIQDDGQISHKSLYFQSKSGYDTSVIYVRLLSRLCSRDLMLLGIQFQYQQLTKESSTAATWNYNMY